MEKLTGKHFSEINKLVLKLRNEFNQKIEEQTDIIRKQRDRLEAQQEQIFNQRIIIEELAWQIRDLRDSVRKCSEQISNNVNAKYHVDTPENHLKLNIPEANDAKQSNHRAEFSPIYESIHFDATLAAQHANTIRRNQIKSIERCTVFEPIGNDKTCAAAPSPNRNNERDVRDCFERCIPPPPITSPPHDSDDSDTDHDPVQINEQTLEKLNSLYSLYKFRQSTGNEIDEVEDVVLRLRKFNDCTSRPFRGSSKAMCSFVSNVEDDYLPRLNEDGDEDDNGSANFLSNEFIRKRSNDINSDRNCRQQQKPIYTQNAEVYI